MDFFERLEEARNRWNVLSHPFYERWESGELGEDELAYYAGEYRHAVVALAQTAAQAATADPELREHAEEEAAHVALWDTFAWTAGADAGRPARAETAECVRSWTAAADELEALAILYAVESGQPAISETKLAGLVEHYGYSAEGPATAYFRLHSELDRAHADQARRLLEQKAGPDDEERLLVAASGALAGNWTLLDGVQHAFSVR
ncbi:MAG TPA: iron-containing redox enzyme family protein [Gaiellaceae bacterium]